MTLIFRLSVSPKRIEEHNEEGKKIRRRRIANSVDVQYTHQRREVPAITFTGYRLSAVVIRTAAQ